MMRYICAALLAALGPFVYLMPALTQGAEIQTPAAAGQTDVRVCPEDGLITATFKLPSGGRVITYFPINVKPGEPFSGTVSRELARRPNMSDSSNNEALSQAASELAGAVKIESASSTDNGDAASVPRNRHTFNYKAPPDRNLRVTYTPPNGQPITAFVDYPQTAVPSKPNFNPRTWGIPPLVSKTGNLHVSMNTPTNDFGKDSMIVGGIPAKRRASSPEGSVFQMPPELAPGAHSVIVSRGEQLAVSQTHVAKVTMTCTPTVLKPGQKCMITTNVYCPGLSSVGGTVTIRSYNKQVLDMPDQSIHIPRKSAGAQDATSTVVERDRAAAANYLRKRLLNSPRVNTPEGQKLLQALSQ